MKLQIESRHLDEVTVIRPRVFEDDRGFFMETYQVEEFAEAGLPTNWVQDNHSRSTRGVLRGLHFQWEPEMSKLMRVTVGTAWLVAVDIRRSSPTRGQWYGREVSAENKLQIWAPAGFARGFCVLSDFAEVQYRCTALYNPAGESAIRWDDPELGIEWPIEKPTLSDRDSRSPSFADWSKLPESERF